MSQQKPTKISLNRKTIYAPREICLYNDSATATSRFFKEIEDEVFYFKRYVLIDFSLTERTTAAAALSLAATITYCQNCAPASFKFRDRVIDFVLPNGDARKNIFVTTGLWEIIRPGGIKKLERVWSDKGNPFKTGNNPAEQYADLLNWLQQQNIKIPRKLASAIQEAYLNIKQHAYPNSKEWNPFLVGRWWQYAYIKPEKNKLVFLLLDRGVGIPHNVTGMKYALDNDQKRIQTAMTVGWTSTNQPGRGRGSADIQEPVTTSEDNDSLLIMSGHGRYLFKQNQVIEIEGLNTKIEGTLIEWALSLGK